MGSVWGVYGKGVWGVRVGNVHSGCVGSACVEVYVQVSACEEYKCVVDVWECVRVCVVDECVW